MFEPLEVISRKNALFNALKDAIFSGQLSSGDALKELHLAKQFNVSQSVIREALSQLEQVGLVTKIPNKGTVVKIMSDKENRERMAVRFKLEELACQFAIPYMQAKDFNQLQNYLNEMQVAILQEQPLQITKNDLEFHQYIWKKSKNNILYNTLTQIVTPLFYISLNMQNLQHWTTKMTSIVTMHEKYLNAIKTGDKKQINSAILSHARDSVLISETSKTTQNRKGVIHQEYN